MSRRRSATLQTPRRRSRCQPGPRLGAWSVALSLALPAGAALERPLVPALPPALQLPASGSAAPLAVNHGLCGWIGHEIPFGLRELASQYAVVAAGHRGWSLAAGLARRGPSRHRERSLWIGLGVRPLPGLGLALAMQGLGWSSAATRPWGWRPGLGAGIDLPDRWRLVVEARTGRGPLPGRVRLRLLRLDASGALAVDLAQRAGRPFRMSGALLTRPHRRLALWTLARTRPGQLGGGALVRRGRLRAWTSRVEHGTLGTTRAWGLGRACR